MKTFILILVACLGLFGLYASQRSTTDDHRSCSCSGTFCTCDISCMDEGEIPSCSCGVFTCICKCNPKDENNAQLSLPTMNGDQQNNSIKGEKYWRYSGAPSGVAIADAIKGLRESILTSDIGRYNTNASIAESTYAALPANYRSAWESWANQNLSK